MDNLKTNWNLDLLKRVRAKLKLYPHCHEVEETALENERETFSGPLGAQTHVTYRGWKMCVDELEVARDTGDLTPSIFELFAMACRSSLPPKDVKLYHPFMCQRSKLEEYLKKDAPRAVCYPCRTSTSHIWSCYIVLRDPHVPTSMQILSLRPLHADPKGFDSTDKIFQKIFGVAEITIVDANMGHSEDVQILSRLLHCLMHHGILPESAINEDDVVRSKGQEVLTAAMKGFQEGCTTLEEVFQGNRKANDAFLTVFRENVSFFFKRQKRKSATAPSSASHTELGKPQSCATTSGKKLTSLGPSSKQTFQELSNK